MRRLPPQESATLAVFDEARHGAFQIAALGGRLPLLQESELFGAVRNGVVHQVEECPQCLGEGFGG